MKPRTFFLAVTAALLTFAPVACKKKAGGLDVYVLGVMGTGVMVEEGDGEAEVTRPALWKNGVEVTPGLGDGASVYCVYVSGKDVYLAGNVRVAGPENDGEGKSLLTLWKNGVARQYSDGSVLYTVNSLFVSGNDVYMAGLENNDKDSSLVTLWKNGVAQSLGGRGSIDSLFVAGGDVYVAGCLYGKVGEPFVATLWKNGVAQRLGDGKDNSSAMSVSVSGNDVYVAGYEAVKTGAEREVVATLWVNGEAKRLGDGKRASEAHYVSVSGKDVYVVGRKDNEQGATEATLWKNGVAQRCDGLPILRSQSDICIYGGDAYWVGVQSNEQGGSTATLWKNNVPQPLGDGKANTWANSVFVVGGGEAATL